MAADAQAPLAAFRWTGYAYEATYESIRGGGTCTVRVRTLERAEYEDARLRADGYAPVVEPARAARG